MKKLLLLITIIFLFTGCSRNEFEVGYGSNLLVKSDRDKLKTIFEKNDIQNTQLFFSWLGDFNKENDNGCGLSNWKKIDKLKYDDGKCLDRYEKNHKYSDGNCRITAFTLIQDHMSMKKTLQANSDYLMFDIDVIENNNNYKNVKENLEIFITLFDAIELSDIENKEEIFPNKWEEYQIKIKDGDLSLISIVMHDKYEKRLFIGHTGVLIKNNEKYLFIEKIAFEQPYQISVIKEKKDLLRIFNTRDTYFEDEKDKPLVYENDKLLGQLSKKVKR